MPGPNGKTVVPTSIGRFLDILAQYYDQLTVFFHRAGDMSPALKCDYVCQSDNIVISLLPPRKPYLKRILSARAYMDALHPFSRCLDALILRVPTPLAWFVWRALDFPPTGLLVVGDLVESANRVSLPIYKKILSRILPQLDLLMLKKVASRSVVATNGPELTKKWRDRVDWVVEVATGTLLADELRKRDNHFRSTPMRLLFVGRNSREKGVEDLIGATARLADEGYKIQVDLAGIDNGSQYGKRLTAQAKVEGVDEAIRFHGFLRLKPDLLELYDMADVMVLPSRWEGVPRVLWEAMGRGCLVVTTSVGGIPMITRHERECLHVPVSCPDLIAEAILRLKQDAKLRKKLVAAGMEQARRHTVEYTVRDLVRAFGQMNPQLVQDGGI